VADVKSSVADGETGFNVLPLKHILECSEVKRQPIQPIGTSETKLKEKYIRTGGS
jgi:hypothetical protein